MANQIVPQLELRQALENIKRRTRRPFYELAAQADMSSSQLSKILSGCAVARSHEKEQLARVVDQPVELLFPKDTKEGNSWARSSIITLTGKDKEAGQEKHVSEKPCRG